jgi:hypothetical protein
VVHGVFAEVRYDDHRQGPSFVKIDQHASQLLRLDPKRLDELVDLSEAGPRSLVGSS